MIEPQIFFEHLRIRALSHSRGAKKHKELLLGLNREMAPQKISKHEIIIDIHPLCRTYTI